MSGKGQEKHMGTNLTKYFSVSDSKSNRGDVIRIDDIAGDIWNCVFYFLNPQDLLHVKTSCKRLNNLTDYNSKAAIRRYWKFQCSRKCSDVKCDDNSNNNNSTSNDNIISDYIIIDWIKLYQQLIQLEVEMEDNEKLMDVKGVWPGMFLRVTNDCS